MKTYAKIVVGVGAGAMLVLFLIPSYHPLVFGGATCIFTFGCGLLVGIDFENKF